MLWKSLLMILLPNSYYSFILKTASIGKRDLKIQFNKNRHSFIKSGNHTDYYQKAKTIIQQYNGYGVISTISLNKKKDYPSSNVIAFASDHLGNPIFYLSDIARNTIKVNEEDLYSFTATEHFFKNTNDHRVSFTGYLSAINQTFEINKSRQIFLKCHNDDFYSNFSNFTFYKLNSREIYLNSGLEGSQLLEIKRYHSTPSDIITINSNQYINKFNHDFYLKIKFYLEKKFRDFDRGEIKDIDQLGVNLRVHFRKNQMDTIIIRVPFKNKLQHNLSRSLLRSILEEELENILY